MKQILIFIPSIIVLIGCGSDSSSGGSSADVEMELFQTYTVYRGNKVVENTDNTRVKVVHINGQDISTIELVEGNATIIRNP